MKKFIGAILLLCCLLLNLLPAATARATEHEQKTVRVGYLLYAGFQEGLDGNPKSGYGYEYLQELSYLANWKYEYVYGGFNELLEKLKRGEIDIMGNISYTPERAQEISFPLREQGREQYYLYVQENRTDIKADDPSTLNGKRIGINKGSLQSQLFADWLRQNNVQCEVIDYVNGAQRNDDVRNGVLDATVSSLLMPEPKKKVQLRALFQIGSSSYYIAVNKRRPDILDDLNAANNKLLNFDWYYNERVFLKYYGSNSVTLSNISVDDRNWFNSKGSFTIGYVDDQLPFTGWDAGKGALRGILAVYQQHVLERYKLHVDTKRFATYEEMRKALDTGEIDSIYPFFCNYWTAETDGLMATSPLTTSYLLLLYKGDYSRDNTPSVIAAAENNSMQLFFIKAYYPKAKILMVHDFAECVNAVLDGRATSTVISSDTYYANRNIVDGIDDCNIINTGFSSPVGFAVKKGNLEAFTFMKHSMIGLHPSDISKAMIEEGYAIPDTSLKQFVRRHAMLAIFLAVLMTVIIGSFIAYYLSSKRRELSFMKSTLELSKKIYIDFATGLPNKNKCEDMIASPEPLYKPTACVMFDLNDLKTVNDSLGHEMGDRMIYTFATLLREAVPSKYFVGRFGGDEFIMIAKNVSDRHEVEQLLQHIKQKIIAFNEENADFKLSYAYGFAYSGDYDSVSISELLHFADEKMYCYKKQCKMGR